MIDWTRLGALRDSIGETEFTDVVVMFLDELAEATDRLEAGVPQLALANELNGIVTSALNLGLFELAEMAQEGRDLALVGRGHEVDVILLKQIFEDSHACFMAATTGPSALRLVGWDKSL